MSTDEYVPDEEQVRAWCREGTGDYPDVMDEWLDRFLARVRRDAAREALDGLAAEVRLEWHERHHWLLQPIDDYRDDSYPETEGQA